MKMIRHCRERKHVRPVFPGAGGYSKATDNEYGDKLHRAGLDEYLDGLDAWLAAK